MRSAWSSTMKYFSVLFQSSWMEQILMVFWIMAQHIPISCPVLTIHSYHHDVWVHVFLRPRTSSCRYTQQLLLLTYNKKDSFCGNSGMVFSYNISKWGLFGAGHAPGTTPFGGTCILDSLSKKVKSLYLLSAHFVFRFTVCIHEGTRWGFFPLMPFWVCSLIVKPVLQSGLQPPLGISTLY